MANVLLGVSAGIAIYKAVDLASTLTQRGDRVYTLMTPNARKFVTPLTFQAVTQNSVVTDIFEDDPQFRPEHISLSEWGEAMVIAPATADLIGRMAAGLGDDIVTSTLLAYQGPVILAPAMNDRMWAHPLVRSNLEKLRGIGHHVIEPEEGHLACGSVGIGRLADTGRIIEALDAILLRDGDRG